MLAVGLNAYKDSLAISFDWITTDQILSFLKVTPILLLLVIGSNIRIQIIMLLKKH